MSASPAAWPRVDVAGWADTRDALQLRLQAIGKVVLANEPLVNHWWNIPLHLTARGMVTPLSPHPSGDALQIEVDLVDHRVAVRTASGGRAHIPLEPGSSAAFTSALGEALERAGVPTAIWTMPVEIPGAVDMASDDAPRPYDAEAVTRFWRALVRMERVFKGFRAAFWGKASPIHVFWGSMDLAYTRFSGRTAPLHPGGAPNCGPHVMHEAYSHEVSSCGYWPGGPGEDGTFYAYAYPDPPGYRDARVGPGAARWDDGLSEFVLPYEDVRSAAAPDAALMEFLRTTYEAAADAARWPRGELERPLPPTPGQPPP